MKVDAWMCDRCGRMRPAEDKVPPAGWLDVSMTRTGESSARLLFCSDQCASVYFRPKPKRKPKAVPALPAGTHVCPDCDRTFGRSQALGAHRSRVHQVAGKSRKRAS